MKATARQIDPDELWWDPIERRVRCVPVYLLLAWVNRVSQHLSCMEHAIHVSAGHFIKGVGPTSSRKILKKVKVASRYAGGDSDDEDVDAFGAHSDSDEGDDDDGDGTTRAIEFDAGDTVGKALALVTQVGHGPFSSLLL
jgi:hypothetical protein